MKSALIVLICNHIQFVAKSHLLNVRACTDLILRLHCCALDDPGHGVPGDVLRLQLRVRLDLLHDVTCTLWRVTMTSSNLSSCLTISASKRSIRRLVITEQAPTRAFSWLKAATTALTFKTLLRHYAKRALTPRSLNVPHDNCIADPISR